jgi:ABC-2 type transport system permease protein
VKKTLAVFRKTLREVRRDRLMLALTLAFAPFFVVIYYLAFPSAISAQTLVVVNEDRGAVLPDGTQLHPGADIVAAIAGTRTADGKTLVDVTGVASIQAGQDRLRDRTASALVVLPADLSATLVAWQANPSSTSSTALSVTGDLTNPSYVVTATLAQTAIDGYVSEVTGRTSPLTFVEEPLGNSAVRTDFDVYVTGLFVFSVIMLVFLTAMTIARDAETGSMRRLRLSRMSAVDYLGGTSAVLLLVALASVLLTYGTAVALGFRSQGPLWVAVLITLITALAVIGIGMMTGVCARTVPRAFVLANFPFGLLAFLSGAVFPLPNSALFHVAGHAVSAFDALPTTHAVTALNKVFTAGTGVSDVSFELTALVVLTALYFAAGALLLQRRRLRGG